MTNLKNYISDYSAYIGLSKSVALGSFIILSIFFALFLITRNELILIIGYTCTIITVLINAILLIIFLLIFIAHLGKKADRLNIIKSILFLLINLPVVVIYSSLTIEILLSHLTH